ncbi:MAG TPA: tRNA lysidine(34) synthetase TilS [Bacilli bacterium]|nr:tRNA lysidine(34) synthetase TilS [Bacilli bacterium]
MKKAYDYLLNSNLFKDNDYIVVGVSGGPDSMALLYLLITIRKKIKINIVCAHVNHNVRKESDDEKLFVEKYCKDNNTIFEYMKINEYKNNSFTESEARTIRYNFFFNVLKKYNSKVLLTAHHGDDLIETILMRIVRGSTLKGYAGFSKEMDINGYKVVKPLIFYTKDEILCYIKKNNIPYVVDDSNNKDKYTRNRYRHNILPFLKKEDKNVNKKFLKFSETLLEYSEYINKEMFKILDKVYVNNKLNVKEYTKLDDIIRKRLINYIFEEIYADDLMLITDNHFKLVDDLINSNKPNGFIKLPNNVVVRREYDYLVFEKQGNDIVSLNEKIELNKNINLDNGMKLIFVNKEDSDSNFVCRLNSKEIKLPLYIRNKNVGDKMYVKGMKNSKKIKDIFINDKISIKDRNKWPIMVDTNDNIVWLPGLKKSKYNKEINEKYDIIIKYVNEED